MAVYTDVAAEDLGPFLAGYDIGALLAYKGIAEGVENSNFLVHTSRGYFILTLYERRVAERDLPFFLGLMEHLASRGITCPQPVKNRAGETLGRLAGRPAAIVTFLDGMWIRRPSAAHGAALGGALARLHLAGADFAMRRDNALSVSAVWARSFEAGGKRYGHVIDPRAGHPVNKSVLSAVGLPSATETDALSTALLVAGLDGYEAIAQLRPEMRALVIAGAEQNFRRVSNGIALSAW